MITCAGKTEGNSVQIKLACEEDQLYSEEYMGGCDQTYELCPKWVTRSGVHMYLHRYCVYLGYSLTPFFVSAGVLTKSSLLSI